MRRLEATISDSDYRIKRGRVYRLYETGIIAAGDVVLRIAIVRWKGRQWAVPYRLFKPVPERVRIKRELHQRK